MNTQTPPSARKLLLPALVHLIRSFPDNGMECNTESTAQVWVSSVRGWQLREKQFDGFTLIENRYYRLRYTNEGTTATEIWVDLVPEVDALTISAITSSGTRAEEHAKYDWFGNEDAMRIPLDGDEDESDDEEAVEGSAMVERITNSPECFKGSFTGDVPVAPTMYRVRLRDVSGNKTHQSHMDWYAFNLTDASMIENALDNSIAGTVFNNLPCPTQDSEGDRTWDLDEYVRRNKDLSMYGFRLLSLLMEDDFRLLEWLQTIEPRAFCRLITQDAGVLRFGHDFDETDWGRHLEVSGPVPVEASVVSPYIKELEKKRTAAWSLEEAGKRLWCITVRATRDDVAVSYTIPVILPHDKAREIIDLLQTLPADFYTAMYFFEGGVAYALNEVPTPRRPYLSGEAIHFLSTTRDRVVKGLFSRYQSNLTIVCPPWEFTFELTRFETYDSFPLQRNL